MHSPAANSQQGERHQQQPQRHKGYDNKTEEPVVRVNKGGQTPGGHWRGGDQYIDEKKRPDLLPAGAAPAVIGLFLAAQIRLSIGHCFPP